jgi:hypothetical protein
MKGGVIELRQKGASLGLIRELLATVGVSTTTSTIRSRTHSRSEHDPRATCRRFASDRRDDRQLAANAAAIFNSATTTDVEKAI